MIEGIDIFAPRDSGLPDLSKITAAQIFNGSSLASLNAMKEQHDPYGLLDQPRFIGTREAINKQTTIDSTTGQRVEVRKARLVDEMLDGKSAKDRGHRKVSQRSYTDSGAAPDYNPTPVDGPDLPENPTELDDLLLLPPPDLETGPSSSLLPPELLDLPKTSWLRKLPTTVLEDLKNLYKI